MRRHAKAPSAGSTQRRGTRRPQRTLVAALAVLLALALALGAATAVAVQTHNPATPAEIDGSQVPNGGFGGLGGLAIDQSGGDLYVIDTSGAHEPASGGAVQRFDAAGAFQAPQLTGAATIPSSLGLSEASDVAVDASGTGSDGIAYVTDTFNNQIDAFDPSDGSLETGFAGDGQLDGSALPPAQNPEGVFSSPCGVVVDQANGNLFVADQGHNRIWIFKSNGDYLDRVVDSALSGPCGLALTSSGDLYVRNANDGKVLRFNRSGSTAYGFASVLYSPDNGSPADSIRDDGPSATDVAVDTADDHVYVDKGDRITEHDSGGSQVSTFGQDVLGGSNGIAVDGAGGKIYVSNGSTLRVFSTTLTTLPDATTGAATAVTGEAATLSGTVDPAGGARSRMCLRIWGRHLLRRHGSLYAGRALSLFPGRWRLPCRPHPWHHIPLPSPRHQLRGSDERPGQDLQDRRCTTDRSPVRQRGDHQQRDSQRQHRPQRRSDHLSVRVWLPGPLLIQPLCRLADSGWQRRFRRCSRSPPFSHNSSLASLRTPPITIASSPLNSIGTVEVSRSFLTVQTPVSPENGASPGQGFLPDNRAWEMVSPPDKRGGDIVADSQRTRAAADGSALGFISLRPFGDAIGTGIGTDYMSIRSTSSDPGSNGWKTHALTPHEKGGTWDAVVNGLLEPFYTGEFSEDLDRGIYFSKSGVLTNDPTVANVPNHYLRTDLRTPGEGSYELTTACPLCLESETVLPPFPAPIFSQFLRPNLAGATPGLDRVLFESAQTLTADPGQAAFSPHLYEWHQGQLNLVGKIPSSPEIECDDDVGPACVTAAESLGGQGTEQERLLTGHVISDGSDGHSRVFFTNPTNGDREGNLYMRIDGTRTVQLNASERTTSDEFGPATFLDASADGTRVFFSTTEQLTEDAAPNTITLYMYDATKPASAPDNLTALSIDKEEADGTASSNMTGLIGVGGQGRYVYFVALGQLVSGEPPTNGEETLYLWHDGTLSYIGMVKAHAELLSSGTHAYLTPRQARVTPNGRHLLFASASGAGLLSQFGGSDYDHGLCNSSLGVGCRELYVYSADSDDLECASCNQSGASGTAMAAAAVRKLNGGTRSSTHEPRAISADGSRIFFTSAERLVPGDRNGVEDAYVFDTTSGEQRLLSSGEDGSPSYFLDASVDASDAFFVTRERLSGWDVDGSYDVYDARIDGGFPEPRPAPPSCQGDACQPAPTELNDPSPGTSNVNGPGNRARSPKPTTGCPKGKRKIKSHGKARCVKKHGKRATNNNRRASR